MTLIDAQEAYFDRRILSTDYPMQSFKDVAGEEAPMRKCIILEYPSDKYAEVVVLNDTRYTLVDIKIGYLYEI